MRVARRALQRAAIPQSASVISGFPHPAECKKPILNVLDSTSTRCVQTKGAARPPERIPYNQRYLLLQFARVIDTLC